MSGRSDEQLYIVDADYRCQAQLVGHSGCSYASPPQPAVIRRVNGHGFQTPGQRERRGQALALVRILLNCPTEPLEAEDAPWQRAAAGGTLTIRLHPASADGQLQL
jgi:hypothetical protein